MAMRYRHPVYEQFDQAYQRALADGRRLTHDELVRGWAMSLGITWEQIQATTRHATPSAFLLDLMRSDGIGIDPESGGTTEISPSQMFVEPEQQETPDAYAQHGLADGQRLEFPENGIDGRQWSSAGGVSYEEPVDHRARREQELKREMEQSDRQVAQLGPDELEPNENDPLTQSTGW